MTDKIKVMIVEGLTNNGRPFILKNKMQRVLPGSFLPGDKVKVSFDEEHNLSVEEFIEPSSNRVKPDCYFHGPCGGCDLLELSEKARKKEKQAMINRTIALIEPENEPYVHPFQAAKELIRYMPRVRIHQSRNYEEREAGFLASEAFKKEISGGIVPVTSCALITNALNKRLVACRKVLSQIPVFLESLTLMSSSSQHSDKVVGHAVLMKGKNNVLRFKKELNMIMKAAQLKGLSVSTSDGKFKQATGTMAVTGLIAPDVGTCEYEAEPSFFVQGNIFQNPVLIRKVIEFCKPVRGKKIVEGFCGAGNFTLALAAMGAKITAIESHPSAVRAARKNMHKSEFASNINLIEGDAIKLLTQAEKNPDILLLDPPRSGTPSIAKVVNKLQPDKIVYVFCDLSAMHKDSKSIIKQGYKLTEVAGLDMYPRTHHVEVICMFEKE